MKVVTIGGGMQDTFLCLQSADILRFQTHDIDKTFLVLEEGYKIEIESLHHAVGGGAVNASVSFVRQGFETGIICKIGCDTGGQYILRTLEQEGVDRTSVVQTDEVPTGHSFIIPCPSGDRVVLLDRGASMALAKEEVNFDAIKQAGLSYITSLSKDASTLLPAIVKAAKHNTTSVACNPGTSQLTSGADLLERCLPAIDILILNSHEAKLLMVALIEQRQVVETLGKAKKITHDIELPKLLKRPLTYANICFDLVTFFEEVLHRGPQIVVVTDGADGVYVGTHEQIIFHPSIPPKKMGNTLGAGDAFGSAFVGSLMSGMSLDDALIRGILNSTSVIEHLDTQTGLLRSDMLTALSEQQAYRVTRIPFSQ